ncbi:MAG TPA: hypothetical protein VHW44_25595 [Pseudonocardiaceae bacterium]|jgi:ABC-type amino acid transport system permease subunit|nr:hypothetical protein [Pseudonocardiaceae bacterium]
MTDQGAPAKLASRLFDLRLIIAVLFFVFGLVVTISGLVSKASTVSASGVNTGVNVNVWTGVPMLVIAVLFVIWALVRPLEIPPAAPAEETETTSS